MNKAASFLLPVSPAAYHSPEKAAVLPASFDSGLSVLIAAFNIALQERGSM